MEIGDRVRELRRRKALTQEQLARAVGRNRATISMIEAGHNIPQAGTVRRIAEALDVPPEALTTDPLGEAPSAQPTEPGGAERQGRLDALRNYRARIASVVKKLAQEFAEAKELGDEDALMVLYYSVVWGRFGVDMHLEDEEPMQQRLGESVDERRARERVWGALSEFDSLVDEVEDAVDALGEKSAEVVHIADLRRRKFVG